MPIRRVGKSKGHRTAIATWDYVPVLRKTKCVITGHVVKHYDTKQRNSIAVFPNLVTSCNKQLTFYGTTTNLPPVFNTSTFHT